MMLSACTGHSLWQQPFAAQTQDALACREEVTWPYDHDRSGYTHLSAEQSPGMGSYKKPLQGCLKSLLVALRAKLYFLRHIIFEISRSEISKMICPQRAYPAACGGEILH
jgi:hypothetical protein